MLNLLDILLLSVVMQLEGQGHPSDLNKAKVTKWRDGPGPEA